MAINYVGPSICADVPYVFRDGEGQALDYPALSDYEGSDLVKVIPVGESPTGGADKGANGTMFIKVDEIKVQIDERLEVDSYNSIVINKAASIAADYPGDYTIEQICAIYEYMKEDWRYVRDPRGLEYYRYANETLHLGKEKNCSGVGDCDDFALLMASLIESIGGTTRIILAYGPDGGHAYAEVYLGKIGSEDRNVERIIDWLQDDYECDIFTHADLETNGLWLNLDWSAVHPGGPLYEAEKNVPIFVRDIVDKVPLNIMITWSKTFGGYGVDRAESVQETCDGGFIIAGFTNSYGAGNGDMWMIKTNSNGKKEWDQTLGRAGGDWANYIQQVRSGGYIIVGWTVSYGTDSHDAWLVKTDPLGIKEWERTFGGLASDEAFCVQETKCGGYIIAGFTDSYGAGNHDAWLVKTDSQGVKEWERTFGGPGSDEAFCIKETSDGGYIVTGSYSDNNSYDAWLVKTDSLGIKEWERTFGGSSNEGAYSVQETNDGGYIIAGYTKSYGASEGDFWLIKTDSSGNEIWNSTFGGSSIDMASSVQEISDGYIIVGYTTSYGAGEEDVWLIKTDSSGNEIWNRTFGGPASELAEYVQEISSGGYIIAGHTTSYGAGQGDFWLIKTDSNGNCAQAG